MTFFCKNQYDVINKNNIKSLFCQWHVSLFVYIADKKGIFLNKTKNDLLQLVTPLRTENA